VTTVRFPAALAERIRARYPHINVSAYVRAAVEEKLSREAGPR